MVLIYILLFSCFTILARASKRIFHFVKRYFEDKTDDKKRIMIVGGGEAGELLIKDMQRSDRFDYKPVCVVDDNPEKIGGFISGVKVAGATKDIVDSRREIFLRLLLSAKEPLRLQDSTILLTLCLM